MLQRADRTRPILSRLASHAPQTLVSKVHPRCCRSLCWEQTPSSFVCEDLLDEMDIHEEALTLALRVRRHQFDANTGNLRSSAQITAQIDPRSASPSDGSDPICPSIPHDCVYMLHPHAATKHFSSSALLCACSVRLCACSAWHLFLIARFHCCTFFLIHASSRAMGGTPRQVHTAWIVPPPASRLAHTFILKLGHTTDETAHRQGGRASEGAARGEAHALGSTTLRQQHTHMRAEPEGGKISPECQTSELLRWRHAPASAPGRRPADPPLRLEPERVDAGRHGALATEEPLALRVGVLRL